MAENDLRQLERAWKESGSVIDEAAYLREMVRTENLIKAQVQRAASFGHRPAQLVIESDTPGAVAELTSLLGASSSWDRSLQARVYLAITRGAYPAWLARFPADRRPQYQCAQAAAEAEVVCHSNAAQPSAQECGLQLLLLHEREGGARLLVSTCLILSEIDIDDAPEQAVEVLERLPDVDFGAAICKDVVPWLLGYGDPVRDRIGARQ